MEYIKIKQISTQTECPKAKCVHTSYQKICANDTKHIKTQ